MRHLSVIALAAVLAAPALADGHEPDYAAIAKSVVTQSAGVQPGDVVLLNGSEAELGVLKALHAAVIEAGGLPITTIDLPAADKAGIMAAPMEHLSQEPKNGLALIEAADVSIEAAAIADPTLFADVPEERINAVREAGQVLTEAGTSRAGRFVALGQTGGIPTPAYAESQGADPAALRAMFWEALSVTPETIAERGASFVANARPGTAMRLTAPGGTDLTFTLSDDETRLSTGRASDNVTESGLASAYLPAGDFYACVDTTSVTGTIAPPPFTFRGQQVTGLSMTFENGAATAVSVEEGGEALLASFEAAGEPSLAMGVINIGLNPNSAPLDGSIYRSWEMSGVVTPAFGDNRWAGCGHEAEGFFAVHLDGATLAAGDAEVVSGGELVLN